MPKPGSSNNQQFDPAPIKNKRYLINRLAIARSAFADVTGMPRGEILTLLDDKADVGRIGPGEYLVVQVVARFTLATETTKSTTVNEDL
jgi:hypothetical protein